MREWCGVAFKEQFYLGPVDSSRRLNTYSGRRQTPPQTFFYDFHFRDFSIKLRPVDRRPLLIKDANRVLSMWGRHEPGEPSQWHKSIHQSTHPAVGLWSLHPSGVKVKASSSLQGRPAKHAQLWTVGGSRRTWADVPQTQREHSNSTLRGLGIEISRRDVRVVTTEPRRTTISAKCE